MERIYLDNAATSWPKPSQVAQAIQEFYMNLGSASGRGSQASEFSSDHIVRQCRSELEQFLGAGAEDSLVFAFNGTDAINLALWGFLTNGDHVVATTIEHNSVVRPLHELSQRFGVTFDLVDCDETGQVDANSIRAAIKSETKLVVVCHASNVTGAVQDIEAVADVCRNAEVALMVDAAQTVGHVPLNFQELGCDFLVAPGHKGLMGPLGTGFLLLGGRVKTAMNPWRAGGTGTASELTHQPLEFPSRLEAGNLNVGGLAGLLEGLRFVREIGCEAIGAKERELLQRAAEGLDSIPGVRVFGATGGRSNIGVLSFEVEGQDPREVAMILDSGFGIQVRAGLHCAPTIHKRMGTLEQGGTVRISPGWYSTSDHIEKLLVAISEIANLT